MLRCCRCLALIIALFVSLAWMPNKTPAQPQTADELLAHARETASNQGSKAALPELERVLALYREKHDRHGEAITLGVIGNCYEDLADYPRALDYLGRSLELKIQLSDHLEEGKTLSNLGLVYWDMAEFPKAIDHYHRSLAIAREVRDRQLEASVLNNLGLVFNGQGEYHRALEYYQQALPIHRAIRFERGELDTLGNIGGVYLDLGRYPEATPYYKRALAMDQRLKLKRSESLDLGNLALCYVGLGELREAADTYDRALTIAREGGFKKDEADWHKGKGSVYVSLGKFDLARAEYEQALRVYKEAGLKRELVEALEDEGTLLELLGDGVAAAQDFRSALDLSRAIGHPKGITSCLLALGDLEWRRKRLDQAAALYHEAFERARESDDRGTMATSLLQWALTLRDQRRFQDALPRAEQALDIARTTGAKPLQSNAQYVTGELQRHQGEPSKALEHYLAAEEVSKAEGDTELTWRIAYGKGQVLESLGNDAGALAAYRQAVEVIESVRSQLREERFQAGYLEDKSQVYVALVRLLLKTGKLSQAFHYAEKMRAHSYAALLEHNQAPVVNPSEARLRARIRQLQHDLEEEQSKPSAEQRRQKLTAYSSELEEAQRSYETILDDLRSTHPGYAAARALSVPTAREIQSRLDAHTALIEFIVGDDCLAVFVLSRTNLRAKVLSIPATTLNGKIELLRDLIRDESNSDWMSPARSLGNDLIRPLEQEHWLAGISRLYLIPNAELNYLPFAALLRSDSNSNRFLIEDYELAYLPAASALVQGPKPADPEGKLFALAPAVSNLKYAQEEVRNVGALLGGRSVVLVDHSATKKAFTSQAGRFELIHLATHGFFDQMNPMFSGVQLEPEHQENGRLEVHEILGLRLHARLVTLSACETALESGYFSDYPVGDDFVGLTRAFLFAGSSQVLATLWEVNDRSTSEVMRGFYGNLQKSQAATALRKAQLAALQAGGRYRHPYFWAPFVLVGVGK